MGWKGSDSPNKLYTNNKLETSPLENAITMNNFFIDKVETIKNELPAQTLDPLATLKTMMGGCPSRFDFAPVSPKMTDTIIRTMKNSKACGIDYIDSYILKLT